MFAKLLSFFRSSEGARSTALVTGGNIVATGLGAVAMILIFRLLRPEEFGIFSAIFAMMSVIMKLADFGTNIALQRTLAQPDGTVDEVQKSSIWYLTLYFKLGVGFLVLILGWLTAPYLSRVLHLDPIYLRVGYISSLGFVIYDQAVITAQAMHKFGIAVMISATQSLLKIIGIVFLYLTSAVNPTNLIILYGIMPVIGALVLPVYIKLPKRQVDWRQGLGILWGVVRWTSLAVISASLADNLDVLMVQSMLNEGQTGLYSAGARIAGFVSIVSMAIGVVLNVRVAKYKTREHIDAYLSKAHKLALVSVIVMLLSIPFASLLIWLTAGTPYLAASNSLQLLLMATGLVMATSPYVALFYTFDKPSYFAYSGILIVVGLLLGNWLLIPSLGINGAALSKLVTRALVLIFTYRFARRAYEENFTKS